jgi:putative transcription factor
MSTDWDTVTILRKKPVSTNVMRTESAVNAARKSGAEISSEKKAVSNQARAHDSSKAAKIDRETEDFHIEKVDISIAKGTAINSCLIVAISKARTEKALTQKDLATKINEKPAVVTDYESGLFARGIVT